MTKAFGVKTCGIVVAVVGEIAVVGVGHRLVARLQLDEEQRQAVDEADEVGALGVELAREPDLRGEEEVVGFRVVPVDDADGLGDARAARVRAPRP